MSILPTSHMSSLVEKSAVSLFPIIDWIANPGGAQYYNQQLVHQMQHCLICSASVQHAECPSQSWSIHSLHLLFLSVFRSLSSLSLSLSLSHTHTHIHTHARPCTPTHPAPNTHTAFCMCELQNLPPCNHFAEDKHKCNPFMLLVQELEGSLGILGGKHLPPNSLLVHMQANMGGS